MWLHIVIFVILLLLTVCSTLGWIHVENIGTVKGRKMFLVVALAGNITGGLLTWTKGGGQVFEDGYELKKEENAYEEKFMVSVEGEETGSVYVQIPEKELEKEDTGQPEVLTKEEDEEQKLLEFVANYNSELEDSEYYYLPSDWEGLFEIRLGRWLRIIKTKMKNVLHMKRLLLPAMKWRVEFQKWKPIAALVKGADM